MSKQKGGQEHRIDVGKRVLNTLASIIAGSDIVFSSRYNGLYGLNEFVAILAEMCRSGITANEAVQVFDDRTKMPTARWFRDRIKTASLEGVRHICDKMMIKTVSAAKRGGLARRGPIMVAIDKHMIPRHDRGSMLYLVYSKFKSGTSKFEGYATVQAVAANINAVLGCLPLVRGDFDVDFVRKFAQNLDCARIMVRLFLMDREFYSVEIMREMYRMGKMFLMPAVKNSRVQRAILLAHEAGQTAGSCVHGFTIRNNLGQTASFNLVIIPSDCHKNEERAVLDRYVAFATSLPVSGPVDEILIGVPADYRRRWGIETGYRQIEQVRAKTTSRSQGIRLLVFFASVFVYNMWAIERNRRDIGCRKRDFTLLVVAGELAKAAKRQLLVYGSPGPP